MTKTKDLKPFTVHTAPLKVVSRIHDLEDKLKHRHALNLDPTPIKAELWELYRLRQKQKNYIEPTKKVNLKRGL